jgi:dipeptidyl aminopeptidase/acylaminoacyl peptidase
MKLLLTAALALAASTALARPFAIDDLVALDRIAEPVASPDGRTAAFALRETDLAANRGRYDLFLLDLTKRGARPVRFQPRPDSNETSPVFSPDGRTLYFLSSHGGTAQVWSAPVAGGEARQVTKLPVDVGGFKLAPTGDRLALWAEADVNCPDLDCAAAKARAVPIGSGRTHDQLFVRHWDSWSGAARSRLFTVTLADGIAAGPATLVSAGLVGDVPSKPSGGGEEIGWSPDGRTVYFALREAGRTEAQSTNLDIFAAPADGSARPVNLTAGRRGTDTQPNVSPDGRTLAWIAMERAGYEADREVVWLRDLATGRTRALTAGWDRSVSSLAWTKDGRSLLVTARDVGHVPAFRVDIATGEPVRLTGPGSVSTLVPLDRGALVTMNSLTGPDDLYRLNERGRATRLTNSGAGRLAGVHMGSAEQFSFKGANSDTVHAWVVKPANLPRGRKAPVALLIHGGPQSSFNNSWSYRWNPQVYAGAGYAVVMIDFHGSAGYGQAFTDSINQDWGGKPLEDLKLGLAAALERYDWMDGDRACALGGSYGGFMTNWIAGHWPDRFKCLVTHAGIFDQRSMYYGTEELWFPEWDFGGPYYQVPQNYERWNPANDVTKWKTPMLVLHGQLDYRVPYLQGIQAFTALQRREIPSRLVMFPDENHWILKPANSLQWHREVLGWLDRHLKQ